MTTTDALSDSAAASGVADQLAGSGAPFRRDVYLHGLKADFLVTPSSGRRILFEVKDWEPTRENIERAAAQARLIADTSKVQEAYLVLTKLKAPANVPGVVAVSDIGGVLGKVDCPPAPGSPAAVAFAVNDPLQPPDRSVFAAMPFAGEYDDVYFVAMAFAAERAEAVVRRTDKESFEGDIVAKVRQMIRRSIAVIADLSELKPNVMYEVGYAHALELPTVLLCSTPLEDLPFDLRNWNVLHYVKGKTFELRERLAKQLTAVIQQAR